MVSVKEMKVVFFFFFHCYRIKKTFLVLKYIPFSAYVPEK